ncbi:hypothetical protein DOK67_0001319 [Enterococcus sp. DIV0212c]|uniref:hypothetical protein n=1 Tax=Enterococcus sp. DIV0212c TaxID=2230867 RepID=UPI001A9BE6F4|nr:hypothetical protein [Enterococcus sp. DIV0212c]MBO1355017.1 hypothetical protein [Enterococcus sp. DIV0212c]
MKMKNNRITLLVAGLMVFCSLMGTGYVEASEFQDFLNEDTTEKYSGEIISEKDVENVTSLNFENKEVYAKLALEFSNSMNVGKVFKISEMIPIYDGDKNFIGYDCRMQVDNKDHGYVIVDNRLKDDYISEFNLKENVTSLFNNLVEVIDKKSDVDTNNVSTEDKVIISNEATVYNVNIQDVVASSATGVEDSERFIEELENQEGYSNGGSYGHSGDVMTSYPSNSGYSYVESYGVGAFIPMLQEDAEVHAGKFACSVTAMSIMAEKLGIARGATYDSRTINATYNKLWKDSGTSIYKTAKKNGKTISYGSTYDNKLIPAMNSLAKSKNKTVNSAQIYKPVFSQMKSYLRSNKNFIFGYNVGQDIGHSVVVQGYHIGKKGTNSNFLIIADGWTINARYINFTAHGGNMTNTCMTAFW